MDSFSVSTRNAEIRAVSCEMSIINQNSFAILLRKTTLIGRCDKRHKKAHQSKVGLTIFDYTNVAFLRKTIYDNAHAIRVKIK